MQWERFGVVRCAGRQRPDSACAEKDRRRKQNGTLPGPFGFCTCIRRKRCTILFVDENEGRNAARSACRCEASNREMKENIRCCCCCFSAVAFFFLFCSLWVVCFFSYANRKTARPANRPWTEKQMRNVWVEWKEANTCVLCASCDAWRNKCYALRRPPKAHKTIDSAENRSEVKELDYGCVVPKWGQHSRLLVFVHSASTAAHHCANSTGTHSKLDECLPCPCVSRHRRQCFPCGDRWVADFATHTHMHDASYQTRRCINFNPSWPHCDSHFTQKTTEKKYIKYYEVEDKASAGEMFKSKQ